MEEIERDGWTGKHEGITHERRKLREVENVIYCGTHYLVKWY